MSKDDLITSAEAAEILGVDRSTITRWSDPKLRNDQRRLVPARKFNGLRAPKLFRRIDVERLAAELAEERSA